MCLVVLVTALPCHPHRGDDVPVACTEIELLIDAADSPVPVFPTTRLHVEAAVDASLAASDRA